MQSWHIQIRVAIPGPYLKHGDNLILVINLVEDAPTVDLEPIAVL